VLILGDRIEVHNPSDPDGEVVGQKNTRWSKHDRKPDHRDGSKYYRFVKKMTMRQPL